MEVLPKYYWSFCIFISLALSQKSLPKMIPGLLYVSPFKMCEMRQMAWFVVHEIKGVLHITLQLLKNMNEEFGELHNTL